MSVEDNWQDTPKELAEAVAGLDAVLARDDVPPGARLQLTDVYARLLDVRPPYDPIDAHVDPTPTWVVGVERCAMALVRLVDSEPSSKLARRVEWAVAARELRTVAAAAGQPAARPEPT